MPGWFTFPFKALSRTKPASRAMAEASESLVHSSAKVAEKASKLAAKGDAAGAAKLLEQASKTAQEGKALANTSTLSEAEKLAKLKRYGIIGAAGFLGYEKIVEGHGVVSTTAGMLLDTPEEGQGYVSKQWETFVGKHNAKKGLAEFGVDAFLGDGSYQYAVDTVSDKYHGINECLSGFFARPGENVPMPYPAQQGYDPQYYLAVNNPNADIKQGGFLSRWNAATKDINYNLPEWFNKLTGANANFKNMAEAIVGVALAFSPFGKLAKFGGILLGAKGFSSMFNGQQQQQYVTATQQLQMINSAIANGQQVNITQQQYNALVAAAMREQGYVIPQQQYVPLIAGGGYENDYDEQQVVRRGRGLT